MILKYGEAVEQALGTQQLQMFDIASLVGFLLLMVALLMCVLLENKQMKIQVCVVAITYVVGGALLLSPQCIKGDILKNAGLGDKSSYYSTQLDEKYDLRVMPSTSEGYYWWCQEFYAVSKDTGEVKAYLLDEVEDGYLTLFDVEDGKAISIHQ